MFSTSAGQSVAAGKKSVTLGPGGALSVALVPNAAGTFYTVVYQLDDGVVLCLNASTWSKPVQP
jgi:hypothetical protein